MDYDKVRRALDTIKKLETTQDYDIAWTHSYEIELLEQLVETLKPQRTQYKKIMDYFNEHSGLPKIREITSNRKIHLDARLKEHGVDSIYEVIDKVGKSDVLRYGFNGWRGADWNFIMKADKYTMILEGVYDNKDEPKKQGLDDFLKDVE